MVLAQHCSDLLARTEQRVNQLVVSASGAHRRTPARDACGPHPRREPPIAVVPARCPAGAADRPRRRPFLTARIHTDVVSDGSHDSGVPGPARRPRARRPRAGAEPRARAGAGRRRVGRGRRRARHQRRSARRCQQRDSPARARPSVGEQGRPQARPRAGRVRHRVRGPGVPGRRSVDRRVHRCAAQPRRGLRLRGGRRPRSARPPPGQRRARACHGPDQSALADLAPGRGAGPRHARPLVHLAASCDPGRGATHRPWWRRSRRAVQAAVRARPRCHRQGRDRPRRGRSRTSRRRLRGLARLSVRCCRPGADPVRDSRRQGQPGVARGRAYRPLLLRQARTHHELLSAASDSSCIPASRSWCSPRSRGRRRAASRRGQRSRIQRLRCTSTAPTPRCW